MQPAAKSKKKRVSESTLERVANAMTPAQIESFGERLKRSPVFATPARTRETISREEKQRTPPPPAQGLSPPTPSPYHTRQGTRYEIAGPRSFSEEESSSREFLPEIRDAPSMAEVESLPRIPRRVDHAFDNSDVEISPFNYADLLDDPRSSEYSHEELAHLRGLAAVEKVGMAFKNPDPGDIKGPDGREKKEITPGPVDKKRAGVEAGRGGPIAEGEEPLQVNDELEGKTMEGKMGFLEDAVARGTARGLAGVPQQKPMQQAVGGYAGSRNVLNEDVQGSSASGNLPAPLGPLFTKSGTNPSSQGDQFVIGKQSHDSTTDTLRPTFGIAPANGVIPTKRQQVESDLLFNDFSIVAPGYGLGINNKMFLMEEQREKKFVFAEPLCEPRKYDGPSGLVLMPALQFQNEITRRDRNMLAAQAIAGEASAVLLERRAGDGSLNILGDDFGMFQSVSDKGLKRPRESPLEPLIRVPKAWERVKPLPGFQWDRKEMRRLFDASRYPERFKVNIAMEGGPTMNRRNSLQTFPFPITSH